MFLLWQSKCHIEIYYLTNYSFFTFNQMKLSVYGKFVSRDIHNNSKTLTVIKLTFLELFFKITFFIDICYWKNNLSLMSIPIKNCIKNSWYYDFLLILITISDLQEIFWNCFKEIPIFLHIFLAARNITVSVNLI